MKKRVLSQIALFLFLLSGLLFTGCENFLNGEEIKDAVVDAIQYGNAPYYSIRVEAIKGSGTIKGNEEVSKRVSDTFLVRFDPEEDHQFIKWEAVIPNLGAGESVSDYIVFEDATSLETNVTFKKANNNILIRPVCPARLNAVINLSEPDVKYPRNSVISLTFSEEISDECLTDISITIPSLPEGKSFYDYYNAPVRNGRIVIFNPKIDWDNVNEDDLIPMQENEVKTVTVLLSADKIFYENTDYSTNIIQYIEKDTRFTFTIGSDINQAPSIDVDINGSNGKFYPAKGRYTVQQFQQNQIEFEPDSDYEFIRWQIYNTLTNEEITDGTYIKIKDPISEKTSYTLIQLPETQTSSNDENEENSSSVSNAISLAIRPVIAERPQVISNAPAYTSAGVLKDTTIQIMFDYDMDENSIYFSNHEIDEITFQGYGLLPPVSIRGEQKYYGYIKDGTTYFKNVTIINSRNNASITDRFSAPIFENARTLAIPVKSTNALAPGMNVMVTIEKDVYRSVEYNSEGKTKPVSMSQAKKWLYLVNGETDTQSPSVADGNLKIYDSTGEEITASNAQPTITGSNITSLKFFKSGEFKLALRVHDNTVPSSTFTINLKKITDSSYNSVSAVTSSQNKEYTSYYGENAVYGDENSGQLEAVDCKLNTKNLTDGVYGLSITVKDSSGNSLTLPVASSTNTPLYYFSLDSTGPDLEAPSVTDGATADKLVLTWDSSESVDYKSTKIRWRKWGSTDEYQISDAITTGSTYTISGLTEGTRYEIIADYTDIAGNINPVPVAGGAYTRPAPPKSVSFAQNQNYGTSATVIGTKPDVGNCTNLKVRYSKTGENSWTEFENRITFTSGSVSGSSTATPTKGYKYDIEVCTYDSASGKYSFPYYTSGTTYPLFTAAPNLVSSFELTTRNPKSMVISWGAPTVGNCSGYIVDCSANYNFPSGATQTQIIESSTTRTATFTNLIPGTGYYFRVSTYYEYQNNKTAYDSGVYYSKCATATGFSATPSSNNSINVSWTAPEGGYSSYKLYYKKTSDTSYSSYKNVTKGEISTTVTGLSGGESYDFKLETVGSITAQSNTTSPITGIKNHPNPATNLRAEKVSGSNTQYTVTWSAPESGDYTGYKLYTATSVADLNSATAETVSASESVSKSLTGTANGLYYIKVKTYRTVGSQTLETETDPICCSLALDSVKSLAATAKSKTSIQLNWTNPSSSSVYDGIRIYKGNTLVVQSGSTSEFTKSSTSYTVNDTSLSGNTNCSFTVTTYKIDTATNTELKADSIISRYTLSNPITSVSASANGPNSIKLSWTYPASGTYKRVNIYKNDSYMDYWSSQTSSDYGNFVGGTQYTFKFITLNNDSVANTAEPKSVTITTPSAPVTNLKTTSIGSTSVSLSWTNPTGNYTGVKVYKKLHSSTSWGTAVSTITNGATSYTVSSLTQGSTYDFKVESYYSNISNVGDTSAATITSIDTIPAAASSFALYSRTNTSLTFSWSKPTGGISGYILYYSSNGSSYTSIPLTSDKTSYTINSLSQGTYYYAYLRSYYNNETNKSDTSTLLKGTNPGTPTNFSVSIYNEGTKISWSSPSSGGASQYKVYYKLNNSSSYSSVTTTGTSYTFANTDLSAGVYYNFYVTTIKTINSENLESAGTSVKSIYTPPKQLTFSTYPYIYQDDGMGTITLRWWNYSGRGDVSGIYIYLDGSYYTSVSYLDGKEQTLKIVIPNYSRGSSHYFYFKPYHGKNSTIATGPLYNTGNLTTSSGHLRVNGIDCDYTKLVNVITSTVYINDTTNAHKDGAYYKDRCVYLSPYSMGAYEVTQKLYKTVMGSNPSYGTQYDRDPVNQVNYYHAIAFCNKLSVLHGLTPCYYISGKSDDWWGTISHSSVPTSDDSSWNAASLRQNANGYRLPTEAQNEFAARGGSACLNDYGNMKYTTTPWTYGYPGSNDRDSVAWTSNNSGGVVQYVGYQKPCNAIGLYDMSGNVREWLSDWNYNPTTGTYFDPYCGYNTSNSSGSLSNGSVSTRSTISKKESKVLMKGGHFGKTDDAWVDSNGDKMSPSSKDKYTGFRICRNVTY